MTLISPNKHLQSSAVGLSLTGANGSLVSFGFVSGSPNFYPNKPIALTIGSTVYQTVYKQVWNGTAWTNWLDFGAVDISAFTYPTAASLVDTFTRNSAKDNENLTASDLMTAMVASDQTPTEKGSLGLVTGLQSLKASRNRIPVAGITVPYANAELEYQCIGLIQTGLDAFTDVQEFSFKLSNEVFQASFILKYSRNGAQTAIAGAVTEPWSLFCESFEAYGDPGLTVTVNVLRQYTGTELFGIYVRFANISTGNAAEDYDTKTTLYLSDVDQLIPGTILPANDGSPGAIGNLYWNYRGNVSNPLGNYSVEQTQDIPFDGVIGYTQMGPIDLNITGYTKFKAAQIPDGTDLDILGFPGIWAFYDIANIGGLSNLPTGVAKAFTLEIVPLTGISTIPQTRQVLQRLETYYIDGSSLVHSMVWERVSVAGSGAAAWSVWEQVGKAIHTHVPSDILTNPSAMFVTQVEIDAWNAAANFVPVWTSPVATYNDLAGANGTTTLVIATGLFYTKIAGVWVPTSANSVPTANGTITAPGLITQSDYNKFNLNPFAIQAGSGDAWVFYGNPANYYGSAWEFLPTDALDFSKRSTSLAMILGENGIAIGFGDTTVYGAGGIAIGVGNTVSGANAIAMGSAIANSKAGSVAIGNGIVPEEANGVYLGNWNIAAGFAFSVGNGTGSGAKSNLFGVTDAGLMKLSGGYAVNGKTSTDILLGDGTTLSVNDLQNQIIATVLSNGKLYIYLRSGFDTFTLDWADGFVSQFGQFANLQAHSLIGKNQYSIETLPVEVTTEWLQTEDIDPTLPYIDVPLLVLGISGSNWTFDVSSLVVTGETTGYQLLWMDEEGSTFAVLATAGLDGVFGTIPLSSSSVPNGAQLQIKAIDAGTLSPIYHIWNNAGTLELWNIDYGEDPSEQQWVNKNLQAVSYEITLSSVEAMVIIS